MNYSPVGQKQDQILNSEQLTVNANQAETALCESVWLFGVGVRRFRQQKGNPANDSTRWQVQGRKTRIQKGVNQIQSKSAFQRTRKIFNPNLTNQKNENVNFRNGKSHVSTDSRNNSFQLSDRRIWLRENSGRTN